MPKIPLDIFLFAHAYCWKNCGHKSGMILCVYTRLYYNIHYNSPLNVFVFTFSSFQKKLIIARIDFGFCKLSIFGDVVKMLVTLTLGCWFDRIEQMWNVIFEISKLTIQNTFGTIKKFPLLYFMIIILYLVRFNLFYHGWQSRKQKKKL